MGRTASSKHKSSKKNKSKLSSQTGRKKTSRRNKSKRLRSLDDSASYSDESSRSMSVSSSDSEDDYKRRKGRSRVRDKGKSSKKRVRRSSSSEDSSVDSRRVKMRKRSKRNGDSKVRTKTKKKKTRRKASSSSSSSDSLIKRVRRHDSLSDTEESDYERTRGRSRKRKSDKRSSGNARIGSKKIKMIYLSCSSCDRNSDYSNDLSKDNVTYEINQSEDKAISEVFPRRLKSVITVVEPRCAEEVSVPNKDEHKEEIFYDEDDYPSCRSNDSNDWGRRDIVNKTCKESDKEKAKNMEGQQDFGSKHVSKKSSLSSGDRINQIAKTKSRSDEALAKGPGDKNEIDVSTSIAGSGSEDLETILRQKALENLMRFRGPGRNLKPTSHHENESEEDVKLYSAKGDAVQSLSSKQERLSEVAEAGGRNQNYKRTMGKDFSHFVNSEEMNLDEKDMAIKFGAAKQVEISGNPKDNYCSTLHNPDNKSESNTSLNIEQPLRSSLDQVSPSPVSAKRSPPVAMTVINKSAVETGESVKESDGNNQNVDIIDASRVDPQTSSIKPISEEHNSKTCPDESNGNSQFEQKTMSVMRGGEMVQVSYKVYIPNKAPALSRRKLQR